jgi:DNA-binding IclR family transcriptional regulator
LDSGGQRKDPARPWPVRVKRPGERRSLSRSATRALDVLELFGRARGPLRAIEIAKALDLHASTADQLLKTMVDSAHLVFDGRTKTYLPSHRLARFSAWIVESYGTEERLRALVAEIEAAAAEVVVTLTTPNDLFMQVLDLAGGDAGDRPAQRGLRISVFGSVVGAAYLSTLPAAEVERLADRARLPQAERRELLAQLESVRQAGFAEGLSVGESAWSLATPLPALGLSPLVLGLAGPAGRIRPESARLQAIMQAAVERWASAPPAGL